MRKQLCDALVTRSAQANMAFLTGDLGFMALEPLKCAMGKRFINSGIAEQNMISVAAALCKQGLDTWVYSIAPFCYARPFEQIRNDICFHDLPVKLIGNGGGYAYGVMGPTHHAIEDYGILLSLPRMKVFIPVFDEDIESVVELAGNCNRPSYLRLGQSEAPQGYIVPKYLPWRQLTFGDGCTVIAVGPLAGSYIDCFQALPTNIRPNLWAISELPLEDNPLPDRLFQQIQAGIPLCVAEEHVARGGFGSELSLYLLNKGLQPAKFLHLYAKSHRYSRYGSQSYLRIQSGLHPKNMMLTINILSQDNPS